MKKKQIKNKCVRCGSIGQLYIDFGLMGLLLLCPVCWIGLAGAMARDFEVYKNFNLDYIVELNKSWERRGYFKSHKV